MPAMAWGIIERCYDASVAYVRERRQFGRAIGEFQAVQLKIADLFLKLRTVENVVFRLAWMQQHGKRDLPFVNASKAMSAQLAVDAAMTAIQLHGGYALHGGARPREARARRQAPRARRRDDRHQPARRGARADRRHR